MDRSRQRPLRPAIVLAFSAGIAAGLGGCSSLDSYMDPSIIGRWEYHPTTVPVLNYISSIEDRPQELLEFSPVSADDLLPNPADYKLGPGDRIEIKLHDLLEANTVQTFTRMVDIRGLVDVPQLGRFYVNGRNIPQVKALFAEKMKEFVSDPLVELDVIEARQQTFSIVGGVDHPGTYIIPRPDYRTLEGLTNAGRIDPSAKDFYVIRLVPLDAILDVPTGPPPSDALGSDAPGKPKTNGQKSGEDLIDAINAITGDKKPETKNPEEKPAGKQPSPGAIAARNAADRQPGGREPAIDLAEPASAAKPKPSAPAKPAGQPASPSWVFTNGRWAQVKAIKSETQPGVTLEGEGRASAEIVTQRVIRIPRDRLEAGDSRYNVILRPGDVLRVPEPIRGVFYVGGQVRRPGSFILPEEGRMTIRRAIDTAGGLDALAWPERAELVRSLGEGRQAIVSVNLRAIAEGTQPDIYIRPDDQINIGTSFWATPLAVLRNGLRASYGFGFIMDRNFGSDVFGIPPEYKSRSRSPFLF